MPSKIRYFYSDGAKGRLYGKEARRKLCILFETLIPPSQLDAYLKGLPKTEPARSKRMFDLLVNTGLWGGKRYFGMFRELPRCAVRHSGYKRWLDEAGLLKRKPMEKKKVKKPSFNYSYDLESLTSTAAFAQHLQAQTATLPSAAPPISPSTPTGVADCSNLYLEQMQAQQMPIYSNPYLGGNSPAIPYIPSSGTNTVYAYPDPITGVTFYSTSPTPPDWTQIDQPQQSE